MVSERGTTDPLLAADEELSPTLKGEEVSLAPRPLP